MASDRLAHLWYRLEDRLYDMRGELALRADRVRYRLDNSGAALGLKFAGLLLLAATPFVLFFLLQPSAETTGEDGMSTISRGRGPQAPLLAFPLTTPTPLPDPTPTPVPSEEASPSPSPSPTAPPSKPQCSNGRDDDRDGRRDFPADRGCSSRNDKTESPDPPPPSPAQAPAPQPVPAPAPGPAESPACNDGRDNDNDGRVDYPLDRGCTDPSDDDESSEGTVLGPTDPPPPSNSPTVPSPSPTIPSTTPSTSPTP